MSMGRNVILWASTTNRAPAGDISPEVYDEVMRRQGGNLWHRPGVGSALYFGVASAQDFNRTRLSLESVLKRTIHWPFVFVHLCEARQVLVCLLVFSLLAGSYETCSNCRRLRPNLLPNPHFSKEI